MKRVFASHFFGALFFSTASLAAEPPPEPVPLPALEAPSFNFEAPAFAPPPSAPPFGAPAAAPSLPPASNNMGLPGADVPSFSGAPLPPDPIIANLNPQDRQSVLFLIDLIDEFLGEVRSSEAAYRNANLNFAAVIDLLDAAYAAEEAERHSRAVVSNLQAERNLLGNRGALTYVDNMMGKHTPSFVRADQAAGRRNCVSEGVLNPDILACYEHQPNDWMLGAYAEVDWYQRAVYEDGGALQGDLPAYLAEPLDDFYARYATRLEAVQRFVGFSESSTSVVISGLDVGYDAQSRKVFDLPATVDPNNLWSLHASMRTAVSQMTEYMEGARARWQSYERAIRAEYPGLIAQSFARSARRLQDHGRAQAPLYASLLVEYETAPNLLTATGGGPAEYGLLHSAWLGSRQTQLQRLDVLYNCGSPAPDRQRFAIDNLGAGIFYNPVFFIVEMADSLAPGEATPTPIESGVFLGEPEYAKGNIDQLGLAEFANGLGIMPAGGGLTLGECDLIRDGEGEATAVQIAAEEPRALSAFGAADTALP